MNRYRALGWALAGVGIACVADMACAGSSQTQSQGDLGSSGGGSNAAASSGSGAGGGSNGASSGTASGGNSANGGAGSTGVASNTGTGTGTASGTGAGSGTTGTSNSSGGAANAGDAGASSVMVTPHMGNTCLKAATGDYSQAGPYQVKTTSVDLASELGANANDAGPTTYTIFYPDPFEANCPSPVVAWGNGTAVTGSTTYGFYNQNAASYGIVVIASDNPDVGSGQYHKAGIDYMMAQNSDSTSMFYHKLSTRVGVSGHSQGGIGATTATNLIGANCQAEVCVAGAGMPLKTTAFICLTGTADLAQAGCTSTYQIAGPPAFLADWDGGDHVTTETLAGYVMGQQGTIQMMRLYAAWFRCFLADDQKACMMFEGGTPSGCGICKDPGWAKLESTGL